MNRITPSTSDLTVIAVMLCGVWLSAIGCPSTSPGQVQLMPAADLDAIRATLPKVDDAQIQRILHDPSTMWYADAQIRRAYQHEGGFHWAGHNFSGRPSEPFGHANREFPWRRPGGTDNVDAATLHDVKFLWLPKQADGKPWPVLWHTITEPEPIGRINGQISSVRNQRIAAWTFPVDAVLGELLMQRLDAGDYPFELRIRRKESDAWGVDVFRPVAREADYPGGILSRRSVSVHDRSHPHRSAFNLDTSEEILRPIAWEQAVALMLGTRWPSAAGSTFAPTVESPHQIIPVGYRSALVGSDRESCRRCHEHVGMHVSFFHGAGRDWYGHVRGSDQIFSWHPIAPGSISTNGARWSVHLRPEFVEAGIVQPGQPGGPRYPHLRGPR